MLLAAYHACHSLSPDSMNSGNTQLACATACKLEKIIESTNGTQADVIGIKLDLMSLLEGLDTEGPAEHKDEEQRAQSFSFLSFTDTVPQ